AIEVNAFGDVYITGANKFTNNQGLVTTTIKYTQSEDTQATPFISREMVGVLMLAQNYPNPFNSATTIQFYLPKGGPISLEVYNLLGKRVDTIFYGTMGSGEHTVQWRPVDIASGIYIYQLKTDTFIETNKMLYFK
ncbi:MAG: T9SS type A sorting domain-containing protein, partial [candidate division KSB1 bacterium]|nr:T9SS type A sorting domain-containing protein [candidate division KSB1 bacterium]